MSKVHHLIVATPSLRLNTEYTNLPTWPVTMSIWRTTMTTTEEDQIEQNSERKQDEMIIVRPSLRKSQVLHTFSCRVI